MGSGAFGALSEEITSRLSKYETILAIADGKARYH